VIDQGRFNRAKRNSPSLARIVITHGAIPYVRNGSKADISRPSGKARRCSSKSVAAGWGRALHRENFLSGARCLLRMLQCNARNAAAWGSRCSEKTIRPERGAYLRMLQCNARSAAAWGSRCGEKTSPSGARCVLQIGQCSALGDPNVRFGWKADIRSGEAGGMGHR
jgi:hypothetical protein